MPIKVNDSFNGFGTSTRKVAMLVYGIRNTNPPRYALYDVDGNHAEARARIEKLHPEYIFVGEEWMIGKDDAKNMSRAVNKAMEIYPYLLEKFPLPGSAGPAQPLTPISEV